MIRIFPIWLATEALDMRAGTETALARVVAIFAALRAYRHPGRGGALPGPRRSRSWRTIRRNAGRYRRVGVVDLLNPARRDQGQRLSDASEIWDVGRR